MADTAETIGKVEKAGKVEKVETTGTIDTAGTIENMGQQVTLGMISEVKGVLEMMAGEATMEGIKIGEEVITAATTEMEIGKEESTTGEPIELEHPSMRGMQMAMGRETDKPETREAKGKKTDCGMRIDTEMCEKNRAGETATKRKAGRTGTKRKKCAHPARKSRKHPARKSHKHGGIAGETCEKIPRTVGKEVGTVVRKEKQEKKRKRRKVGNTGAKGDQIGTMETKTPCSPSSEA